MPQVHKRTKSTRGKQAFICSACREEIKPGETFYTWQKRYGGPQYRHVKCGYPRPSQLSNRKTAQVEDAIQDAHDTIGGLTVELTTEGTYEGSLIEDITGSLEAVADEAESVADEYESSADNMPEALQYGSQAEAMREVADELRTWADELRSWTPSEDEPDIQGNAIEQQDALDTWANDMKTEATDQMADLPEYQG